MVPVEGSPPAAKVPVEVRLELMTESPVDNVGSSLRGTMEVESLPVELDIDDVIHSSPDEVAVEWNAVFDWSSIDEPDAQDVSKVSKASEDDVMPKLEEPIIDTDVKPVPDGVSVENPLPVEESEPYVG